MSVEQIASVTREKPTFSSIVHTAGEEGKDLNGRDAKFLWMLASGIAHVRMGAVLSPLLDRVETAGIADESGYGEVVAGMPYARGHEQTALHDRVRKIGTVDEFIDWFDAMTKPLVGANS